MAARIGAVALAGAALIACYEPRLRDCALTCSAASDCAGDQQCNGGWCAAPGASCSGEDSGAASTDARPIDARAIDAPTVVEVELRIEVKGRGSVEGDQPGVSCTGPDGDCRFQIERGTVVVLTPVDGDDQFAQWRDACDGQNTTCTLTLDAMKRTKAEFN
ncbi:MAG TPA: hypothetical protein VM261_33265 [Kofleriaceae bacterium]|nr:hypothetical protein [Kofleriaceae bacterium]